MREPLQWRLHLGAQGNAAVVGARLRNSLLGPANHEWETPGWLLPHQVDAARRIAGILDTFGGALLCDAVGLGKTYVALAVASRYRRSAVAAPAVLLRQWREISQALGIAIDLVSHEKLSHGSGIHPSDFVVVDEAHRFRNTGTRRYDRLARCIRRAHVLCLTATPVVNAPRDLIEQLRLFLSDGALAVLGLPSLQGAATNHEAPGAARAISPLVVSRSPDTAGLASDALPVTRDAPIEAPAPLAGDDLECFASLVDTLEFPTFADRTAAHLLRTHVLYRLSSSVPACRSTLKRHLEYLHRAIDAARRGEALSRRDARALVRLDDELQLDLDLLAPGQSALPLDSERLRDERVRIENALGILERRAPINPKVDTLLQVLDHRRGAKTIVFVSAIPTAVEIATALKWKLLAVVTGRGARIASGSIPVRDALDFFSPSPRWTIPSSTPVDVLVATDLASEGLNLQQADGVVNYDLPWTPLRLQQRVGRVVRLGSAHRSARVWWFVPPEPLERRLTIRSRIDTKVGYQRDLGVAISSTVGCTGVLGRALERRERTGGATMPLGNQPARYMVVAARRVAAFALRWTVAGQTLPEMLVTTGSPPRQVRDLDESCQILNDLLDAPPSVASPDPTLVRALRSEIRTRLTAALLAPGDPETRLLRRHIVREAKRAGQLRDARRIAALDAVMERLSLGVPIGGQRLLGDLLREGVRAARLETWAREWRRPTWEAPVVRLDAAVFGDGTRK